MQEPVGFVDIHCHLLPGLDDGPTDWGESLAMARVAVADGISTVVATPHQLGSFSQNRGDTIRQTCLAFGQLLERHGVALRVLPGGDVRIEPNLVGKIRSGNLLTLADKRQYVLLELPHELFLPIDGVLRELDAAGMVGVLSHPERNQGILPQPERIKPMVEAGCLMQVTAGSLVGSFGPQVRQCAEWLVSQGWCHFIATDAHGQKSRRPLLRRAFCRACELVGERAALEMCRENPACVVEGRKIVPGRRRVAAARRSGWFRWGKAG